MNKELSIFIDESGDFGDYQPYCPFYIVTFVFHNQRINLSNSFKKFNNSLNCIDFLFEYIHSGPIVRQEGNFYSISLKNRRNAINIAVNFIRTSPIIYHTFIINRSKFDNKRIIASELSLQIKTFIQENLYLFLKYNVYKIYYDNGQKQLLNILKSALPTALPYKVEFIKINNIKNYNLFQISDVVCTLELINEKINNNLFSKTEKTFFKTISQFKSNYYNIISKKKI